MQIGDEADPKTVKRGAESGNRQVNTDQPDGVALPEVPVGSSAERGSADDDPGIFQDLPARNPGHSTGIVQLLSYERRMTPPSDERRATSDELRSYERRTDERTNGRTTSDELRKRRATNLQATSYERRATSDELTNDEWDYTDSA